MDTDPHVADPGPNTGKDPAPQTKGERTRERIYQVALQRFAEDGVEATSLRGIAKEVGVTPALLYRYFANRDAIIAEVYSRSLAEWAEAAAGIPQGSWVDRVHWLTALAIETLEPHRALLRALVPSMLDGDPMASPLRNESSVAIGRPLFHSAVAEAKDAPKAKNLEAYVELANLAHLGLILLWVYDKTPNQRATQALMKASRALGPWLQLGLKTPVVGKRILGLAETVGEALRTGAEGVAEAGEEVQ